MAHIKLTVDGTPVMDGDLGQWSANPPEILTDQLKAGARPAPWLKAVMLTLAEVAMNERDTTITVTTDDATADGPGNWTLDVDYGST